MTNEQINAAIHAALGKTKRCPRCDSDDCAYNMGPNYCFDLNAMNEAEKLLRDADVLFEYSMHISISHHYEHLLRATARQRAEAFLKTLGKWEEVQC